MPIEAPISKHKKNGFYIYIAVCLIAAIWFSYDGYLNKDFIAEHKNPDGKPNITLFFNQKSPLVFVGAAVLFGVYLFKIKDKKIIADEKDLVINDKKRIPYDSIQKIDKTHFDTNGYFIITYKNDNDRENSCKLSSNTYDNLSDVLDHLVAEIS